MHVWRRGSPIPAEHSSAVPGLPLFSRNRQPEHRRLSGAGNVDATRFLGTGQVERLAMLTAIDLGIFSPGLFGIAAGLLLHVFRVEPALEMTAAELALGVLLIAGALPRLLDLDPVPGELRYFGGYGSAGGQNLSSWERPIAAGFG